MTYIKIKIQEKAKNLVGAVARNPISWCFIVLSLGLAMFALYGTQSSLQLSLLDSPTCNLDGSTNDARRYSGCFSPRVKIRLSDKIFRINFKRLQFAYWQPMIVKPSLSPAPKTIDVLQRVNGNYQFLSSTEPLLPGPSLLSRFNTIGIYWIQSNDYSSYFPSHISTESARSYWKEDKVEVPLWLLCAPLAVMTARIYVLFGRLNRYRGFTVAEVREAAKVTST